MTLSELVAASYLIATGKVSALTSSDTKYQKILGLANHFIHIWENVPNVDWSSLYEQNHSIGSVTATDTFDLDDEIRKISDTRGDYVKITDATGADTFYDVVPADTLRRYDSGSTVCAQVGKTLVFRDAFTSSSQQFGGTIYVPVYLYAEELSGASDDVPVDNPQWLVLSVAAEYVRNDATKQGQYPNLISQANEMLDRMVDDNDAQVSEPEMPWSPLGRSW